MEQRALAPLHRKLVALAAVVALVATLLLRAGPPAGAAPGDATVLYDDEIAEGFGDWSWADVDIASTAEVHSGSVAAAVDARAWEAFFIGTNDAQPLPLDGRVEFAVHGGGSTSEIGVRIVSPGGDSPSVPVQPLADEWRVVSVDLAEFGGFDTFSGIWFDNLSPNARPTYFIDSVRIIEGEPAPPAAGPSLRVDLTGGSIERTVVDPATGQASTRTVEFPHPISDDIYGMNFVTDAVREELDVPVNRWGGNSTERFNHTIGATNLGNDWFFMNSPDDATGADHRFENDNQADGADTIMTLPMLGWVAKDREGHCSYPVNDALGAANQVAGQDATEPHYLNTDILCGNGFIQGERVGGADPTLTSVAVDENFAANWVRELVATHGSAAEGGVEMYALGNEPGLWYGTHEDVHPDPLTRDELFAKNRAWAGAVKSADPSAGVIGPVFWSGWSYYVSAAEVEAGLRPGDVPTIAGDYLAEMSDASDVAGQRLLDHLAINFYDDRAYGGGSDALRLEATRSLWDPSYAPSDWWVTRDFTLGDGSAVIPRMYELIDDNFPGTGLAITEYNFGGNDTVAGGLAQADALGIFGREGLDIATVWDPWADWTGLTPEEWADRPIIDAFRLYRNYDGAGARFGDVSEYAVSTDEGAVAIHAATRTADGAVTILVLNKDRVALDVPLELVGSTGVAERWDWSAATGTDIRRVGDIDLRTGSTELSLAPRSATLLVLDGTISDPEPDPKPDPDPEPEVTAPVVGGAAVLVDAPSSLAEGGPLDSTQLSVFAETGPTMLEQRIRVDRADDGRFRGNSRQRSFIAAGETVCSWYVHADSASDRGRIRGTVTFEDSEILGVIVRKRQLNRSGALEHQSVDYAYGGSERNDRFRLVDGQTLELNMRTGRGVDGVRIITSC